MQRFFVPFEKKDEQLKVSDGDTLKQMMRVLRMRPGDQCVLMDSAKKLGYEIEVLSLSHEEMIGRLVNTIESQYILPHVRLCFGLLKGPRNETIVEKCTELGIAEFQPVMFDRCQHFPMSPNKVRRFEKIITEAAEQSERFDLPRWSDPVSFSDQLEREKTEGRGQVVLYARGNKEFVLPDRSVPLTLWIGPEGGITVDELHRLISELNADPMRLGPTILRAETACIVGASRLLF